MHTYIIRGNWKTISRGLVSKYIFQRSGNCSFPCKVESLWLLLDKRRYVLDQNCIMFYYMCLMLKYVTLTGRDLLIYICIDFVSLFITARQYIQLLGHLRCLMTILIRRNITICVFIEYLWIDFMIWCFMFY